MEVYYQDVSNPVTKQVKYLRVILNRGLNYNAQLTATIYPYIGEISPLPVKLKITFHIVCVRSVLTYAAPTWVNAAHSPLNRVAKS